MPGFGGIGQGIVDPHLDAVFFQLPDEIHHLGVAQVGNVLFESDPQNGDFGPADAFIGFEKELDRPLGYIFAHVVVNPPARQNHFRVVPQGLGLKCQVVGVYADAMAPHQPGLKGQKVPLGCGRFQHFSGVDAHFVENHGQLVHQGDIQIPLGVFNDLGGLCNPYRRYRMNAGANHPAVYLLQQPESIRVGA